MKQVTNIIYDEPKQELTVMFNKQEVIQYLEVPLSLVNDLTNAPTLTRGFHTSGLYISYASKKLYGYYQNRKRLTLQ